MKGPTPVLPANRGRRHHVSPFQVGIAAGCLGFVSHFHCSSGSGRPYLGFPALPPACVWEPACHKLPAAAGPTGRLSRLVPERPGCVPPAAGLQSGSCRDFPLLPSISSSRPQEAVSGGRRAGGGEEVMVAKTHLFGGRRTDTRWLGQGKTKGGCLLQKGRKWSSTGDERSIGTGLGLFSLNLLFHDIWKKKKVKRKRERKKKKRNWTHPVTSYQAIRNKNKQLIHPRAEGVFDVLPASFNSEGPDGLQRGHHAGPQSTRCLAAVPRGSCLCVRVSIYSVARFPAGCSPPAPRGLCSLCSGSLSFPSYLQTRRFWSLRPLPFFGQTPMIFHSSFSSKGDDVLRENNATALFSSYLWFCF